MPLDDTRLDALRGQLVGKLVSVAEHCTCGSCLPPRPLDGAIGIVEDVFSPHRGAIQLRFKEAGIGFFREPMIQFGDRDFYVFVHPSTERMVIE